MYQWQNFRQSHYKSRSKFEKFISGIIMVLDFTLFFKDGKTQIFLELYHFEFYGGMHKSYIIS